jgi:hypothetical protein
MNNVYILFCNISNERLSSILYIIMLYLNTLSVAESIPAVSTSSLQNNSSTLKMEVVTSNEDPVNFYQTTKRYVPED